MKRALFFICLFFALTAYGQDLLRLKLQPTEIDHSLPEKFTIELFFADTLEMRQGLDSLLLAIIEHGYIDASLKSLKADTADNSLYIAWVDKGIFYHWRLRSDNISPEALRSQKIAPYFQGTPLPFYQFNLIRHKIITWYENQGYPFASLNIDSVTVEPCTFRARLNVEPSFFITFDTLQLTGNLNLKPGFIANQTGVKPGMPYSEKKAKEAAGLLADLPFLRINGEPVINFSPGSAKISIPVRRQPANRFDGIAGLSSNTLDDTRLQFTGQMQLLLVNLFERGESFGMNWQGLGNGTQRLIIEGSYPYLLSTPITTSMHFSLHKQDTSYLNLKRRPAFTWLSLQRISLTIYADLQSTELLSTSRFANITSLPAQIDSRTNIFGLDLSYNTQGFFSTLGSGSKLRAWLGAGTKKIKENPSLPQEIYQNILLSQNQYSFGVQAETRLPLAARTTMVFQLNSQGISGKQFFENELFRIGGFQNLKGFNEESIMATFYGIMTSELRFFTGENSFFSLLFNAAYFENKMNDSLINGWPWGAAVGLTLETAPGIISVYYAMGKGPETPLAFRNAKVHIGFISLF